MIRNSNTHHHNTIYIERKLGRRCHYWIPQTFGKMVDYYYYGCCGWEIKFTALLPCSFICSSSYVYSCYRYLPTNTKKCCSLESYYIYNISFTIHSFTHSYIEGLSTTTFSFGIGILKGKFGGQFRFGPIHGGTNHIEQCHGFNINVNIVV